MFKMFHLNVQYPKLHVPNFLVIKRTFIYLLLILNYLNPLVIFMYIMEQMTAIASSINIFANLIEYNVSRCLTETM